MKCENCQNELIHTKTQKYRYIESGLENVFLDNIKTYNCIECEIQIPVIPKILKLHNTIGFAIVSKNSLLNGAEIQFLRKNLRIKSKDWAKLLRTDKTTYSRWENGSQKFGMQSDLLIRYLYLRLLEEKREVRLGKKIVENLSIMTNEKIAIAVDVEKIERYTYLPLTDALRLADIQNTQIEIFDFDIDETNLFLSEIETPLPPENLKNKSFRKSARANQELALAA